MRYLLNPNAFRRIFDGSTYLENQVNHVRIEVKGAEKKIVDSLSYDVPYEVDDADMDIGIVRRLHYLWMIMSEGEDPHDFDYSTKIDTEIRFAGISAQTFANIRQNWLNSLEIILTSKCNERCIHCYIPEEEKNESMMLNIDGVKSAIRQFREMNGMKVIISGGEPLLHPDIEEILQYCREQELMISVHSNLLVLSSEMAKRLRKLRLFNVQFSLYSVNSNVHETITGRKGTFSRTLRGIDYLVANNVPAMISCPVMKENRDSVYGLKEYANSLGLDCYFDYIMMAQSNGATNNLRSCLSREDTKIVIREVVQNNELYIDAIRRAVSLDALTKMPFARRWSSCKIMSNRLCMDTDGSFFPCPGWNSMKLGNIYECSLKQIWNSTRAASLRTINQRNFLKCSQCNLHNFCDMCPVYNVNENGSFDKVSPRFCVAAQILKEVVVEIYNDIRR